MATVEAEGLYPNVNDVFNVRGVRAFTYHHIIPRERLRDFWNNLATNNELSYTEMKTLCAAIIDHHYDRLIGTKVVRPYLRSERPICLEADGEFVERGTLKAVVDKGRKGDVLTATETNQLDIFTHMYQWWGGNIHIGPSDRLNPNSTYWKEDYDDGGNQFEVSAQHVIPQETFNHLQTASNEMVSCIGPNPVTDRGKRRQHIENVRFHLMKALESRNDPWPYDASHWYQLTWIPTNAYTFWRIKP